MSTNIKSSLLVKYAYCAISCVHIICVCWECEIATTPRESINIHYMTLYDSDIVILSSLLGHIFRNFVAIILISVAHQCYFMDIK